MYRLLDSKGKEFFSVEPGNVNYAFDWKGFYQVYELGDWFMDCIVVEAEGESQKSNSLDSDLAERTFFATFCTKVKEL